MTKVRVLLVDDHAVVRIGLRNLIIDTADLCVAGEAPNIAEALALAAQTLPDVILLDLRLPDGSGIDAIESLKKIAPNARILILTSFADDNLLLAALKAGADGYLLKDVAENHLLESIRNLAQSVPLTSHARPETLRAGQTSTPIETLTGQELRIFELVGRGLSNREAADASGLTEKTVRNYLSRVFEKLQLRRRSQVVALFIGSRPWRI